MINQYKEEYNNLVDKKNLKGEEAMDAVREGWGGALRYVSEQTPEICIAAVNNWGDALQYVSEQTNEICLAAVKQDGSALQYVSENMFSKEDEIEIDGKMFSKNTIKNALSNYIN